MFSLKGALVRYSGSKYVETRHGTRYYCGFVESWIGNAIIQLTSGEEPRHMEGDSWWLVLIQSSSLYSHLCL